MNALFYRIIFIASLLVLSIPSFSQKDLDEIVRKAAEKPKSGPYYKAIFPKDGKGKQTGKVYTEDQINKYCKENNLVIGNIETNQILGFGQNKTIVASFEFRPENSDNISDVKVNNSGGITDNIDHRLAYDTKDMAFFDEFEDNRNNWPLSNNDFDAEIRNGRLSFLRKTYNNSGPYFSFKDTDLKGFEAEYSLKAENINSLHALFLDGGISKIVFGVKDGRPALIIVTSLFVSTEDNYSDRIAYSGLNIGGVNKFAIRRLGESLEFFINGTSVFQMNLEYNRFSHLKKIVIVCGQQGEKVFADYIRIKKKYARLQMEGVWVSSSEAEQVLTYNQPERIIISIKNDGNYTLKKQYFKLLPGHLKLNKIPITNSLDSLQTLEPGQEAKLVFEVVPSMYLPQDSVQFILQTYIEGDTRNLTFSLPTRTFFDLVSPKVPSASHPRQKAISLHYGNPSVNIQQCRESINSLSSSGDKIAQAWKGLMIYLGQGGFQKHEDLGMMIMKESLSDLEAVAKTGDLEALYLLANAYLLDLGNNVDKDFAPQLIAHAANQAYLPAILDYGMYLNGIKDYVKAEKYLHTAKQKGSIKALTYLGGMAESGFTGAPDIQLAIQFYKQAAAAGDADAMVRLANIYLSGKSTEPNTDEAIRWATKAAGLGHTGAMLFLAKIFFDGNKGKSQNVNTALQWFTKAANENDREAMLVLGLLYLDGNLAGEVDEKKAFYWIRRAAETGHSHAMNILGGLYSAGKLTDANLVKARYWLNKAKQLGVGEGAGQSGITHPLVAILEHTTFDTHIIEVTEYANGYREERDLGIDYFGDFLDGMLDAYIASRIGPMQEQINGVEFIQTINNVNIYAGTVASRFTSNIQIKKGCEISVKAYGEIQAGFVTFCGPNGHSDPYIQSFSYSDAGHLLHAALIYKIGNGKWDLLGSSVKFIPEQTGILQIAINDRDYSNNKGYFDFVMEVIE
jgi:TPR repeat protein